jgi:hypothetical protein
MPPAVTACYKACLRGVKRAHLVDARIDGGILLELYSRDGIGTMISTDFYEGIRRASAFDAAAIKVRASSLVAYTCIGDIITSLRGQAVWYRRCT